MNAKQQRTIESLQWGVNNGAFTADEANGILKLAQLAGYFRSPDADEPSSHVRDKGGTMSKTKTKTADALKGSKAGALFNGARVKDASERLSAKKYAVKGKDGNPLVYGGKAVETASERDNAVVGVWWKRLMQKSGVPVVFTEFERALLAETIQKGRWCGEVGSTYYGGGDAADYVPNATVKALLDDTTSGGLYLAPVEFDANVIVYPLLSGELFPLVDVVPVTGRRIQGATISNVSMSWGAAAGTAIQPFNTSALVNELSTPVYPLSGAIEISNELMNDSPVNVGAVVTALYGERVRTELDRVIVNGNGYNEPLGITNTSGLVAVSSDNGTAGPPTVSDYEGMIFSVPKQYRQKEWNPAFVSNDTSYRRARGIQVGPGDERRVFGMNHQSYELLDYPFKIQNDLSNSKVLFGCWRRYRAYQRLGSEVVVERGGRQLALANTTLVVVRSRFGGRPIDANAFALMTDAQG
jgi:HK97 family phage major capsid protein